MSACMIVNEWQQHRGKALRGVRRTGGRTKGMQDAGTMTLKGRRLTSRDEREEGREAAGGNRCAGPPLQGTVERVQEYNMLMRPTATTSEGGNDAISIHAVTLINGDTVSGRFVSLLWCRREEIKGKEICVTLKLHFGFLLFCDTRF